MSKELLRRLRDAKKTDQQRRLQLISEYDRLMKVREISELIPRISLPEEFELQILPPDMGTSVRFIVYNETGENCSIYLDCFNMLGAENEPYWELYPAHNGDTFRCKMAEITALENEIVLSLTKREKEE